MKHFELHYKDGRRYLGEEISSEDLAKSIKLGPVVSFTDEEYETYREHCRKDAQIQSRWADVESVWWDQNKS